MTYHSVNDTKKEKPTGSDYTTTMDGKPGPSKGSDRFDTFRCGGLARINLKFWRARMALR